MCRTPTGLLVLHNSQPHLRYATLYLVQSPYSSLALIICKELELLSLVGLTLSIS